MTKWQKSATFSKLKVDHCIFPSFNDGKIIMVDVHRWIMYYSKSSTLLITIYTIMSLLIIVSPLSEIFCLSHIDPPIFNFLRQPTYKYNGKYHHITIFFSFDISVYACIWYRYQTSRILLTCTYYMEFKINKKNMPALVVQFNFFNSIFFKFNFFQFKWQQFFFFTVRTFDLYH